MSFQRLALAGLLIIVLLAPGASASLAKPAAPPAADTPPAPAGSTLFVKNTGQWPETPENFPWQPNQSVHAYLPDCADQGSPDIGIDAAQSLYTVWSDMRNGGSDVYFAYRPAVGTWSANVRVNVVSGTTRGLPKIAVDTAGNSYAVWTDVRNGDADIYFAYRPAGGNWGANRRVNTDPGTTNQFEPAIGVDAAGSISIAWTDDRNVDLDIYTTRGTAPGDGTLQPELTTTRAMENNANRRWPLTVLATSTWPGSTTAAASEMSMLPSAPQLGHGAPTSCGSAMIWVLARPTLLAK